MNRKLLVGVGSAIGVAALAGALVWGGTAQRTAPPTPEPTAVVFGVENKGFVEAPAEKPTPAAPVAPVEQTAPVESVEPPTTVEGEGCPAGYIDSPEFGCYTGICEVLEDGTEVPCVGLGRDESSATL